MLRNILSSALAVWPLIGGVAHAQDEENSGLQLRYIHDEAPIVTFAELGNYTQFVAVTGDQPTAGYDGFVSLITVFEGTEEKTNISFGLSREAILASDFYEASGFVVMSEEVDPDNDRCVFFRPNTVEANGSMDMSDAFERAILDVSPDVLDSILAHRCVAFAWPASGEPV